ncbi:metal-dependent transcriptional regulator [Oscillospiraceae bacterium WX1]
MSLHESAENYLETILILSRKNPCVRSVDIAAALDYTKPSVSVAMKNLRNADCIEMDASGLITLTERGLAIAESMYERHILLSEWLISLGVSEKNALDDACRIEHVISAESFEAIKKHVAPHERFKA